MVDKLRAAEGTFKELQLRMADPDVANNAGEFQKVIVVLDTTAIGGRSSCHQASCHKACVCVYVYMQHERGGVVQHLCFVCCYLPLIQPIPAAVQSGSRPAQLRLSACSKVLTGVAVLTSLLRVRGIGCVGITPLFWD